MKKCKVKHGYWKKCKKAGRESYEQQLIYQRLNENYQWPNRFRYRAFNKECEKFEKWFEENYLMKGINRKIQKEKFKENMINGFVQN